MEFEKQISEDFMIKNLLKISLIVILFVATMPAIVKAQASTDSLITLAQEYFSQGNYDSAKIYFKAALKENKNNSAALRGLGKSYIKMEKWGDAKDIIISVFAIARPVNSKHCCSGDWIGKSQRSISNPSSLRIRYSMMCFFNLPD